MKNIHTLSYKGYLGSVEIDLDFNMLHGKILFINDLVTFEADTPAGLQKAFEEAIDDYLETCAEFGDEPDMPFSGTFNVRVGPEIHKGIAYAASREGIKLNEYVKSVLAKSLEDKTQPIIHLHTHEHKYTPVKVSIQEEFQVPGAIPQWHQKEKAVNH